MSTETPLNRVNTPLHPNMGGNQMVDMMMGSYTMNLITQMQNTEMSFEKVLLLIIVLSLAELKSSFGNIIKWFKDQLFILYPKVVETVKNIEFKKEKDTTIYTKEIPEIETTQLTVNLNVSNDIVSCLFNYLKTNGTYKTKNNITIDNSNIKLLLEQCSFEIPNTTPIKVCITNDLEIELDKELNCIAFSGKNKTLLDYKNSSLYKALDKTTQNHLEKYINDDAIQNYINYMKTTYMPYIERSLPGNEIISGFYANTTFGENVVDGKIVPFFTMVLIENEYFKNNKNIQELLINELFIIFILNSRWNDFQKSFYIIVADNQITISYNELIIFNLSIVTFPISKRKYTASKYILHRSGLGIDLTTKCDSSTKSNLQFSISCNSFIKNEELFNIFNTYLQDKILVKSKKNKKCNVYNICIENTIVKSNIDNPEYTDWKTEYDNAEKEIKIELSKNKPNKNIETTSKKTEIKSTLINSFYKDLSTLYLPEKDTKLLFNVIDKFKNKKHLYEQLGIPYKLGMMFYGDPGTGKTSTVKAVASYLEKDVYFVNLNGVKTNNELKMMFDYINNNLNGGIIMFEDIDVMTNVVKPRSKIVKESVGDLLEAGDDSLSLSYLLNMLDGTLCKENTIFAITTNYINNIDPALYRKGRVDLCMNFKKCDHYQIGKIYNSIINKPLSQSVLKSISEYKYSPCDVISHVYQYILDDTSEEEIMREFM